MESAEGVKRPFAGSGRSDSTPKRQRPNDSPFSGRGRGGGRGFNTKGGRGLENQGGRGLENGVERRFSPRCGMECERGGGRGFSPKTRKEFENDERKEDDGRTESEKKHDSAEVEKKAVSETEGRTLSRITNGETASETRKRKRASAIEGKVEPEINKEIVAPGIKKEISVSETEMEKPLAERMKEMAVSKIKKEIAVLDTEMEKPLSERMKEMAVPEIKKEMAVPMPGSDSFSGRRRGGVRGFGRGMEHGGARGFSFSGGKRVDRGGGRGFGSRDDMGFEHGGGRGFGARGGGGFSLRGGRGTGLSNGRGFNPRGGRGEWRCGGGGFERRSRGEFRHRGGGSIGNGSERVETDSGRSVKRLERPRVREFIERVCTRGKGFPGFPEWTNEALHLLVGSALFLRRGDDLNSLFSYKLSERGYSKEQCVKAYHDLVKEVEQSTTFQESIHLVKILLIRKFGRINHQKLPEVPDVPLSGVEVYAKHHHYGVLTEENKTTIKRKFNGEGPVARTHCFTEVDTSYWNYHLKLFDCYKAHPECVPEIVSL